MQQEEVLIKFNQLIEEVGGHERALSLIDRKCFGMGPSRRTLGRIKKYSTEHGKYKLVMSYHLLKNIIDDMPKKEVEIDINNVSNQR